MKYNFLILVTFFSLQSFSQDKTINNESNVSYYGRDHFLIEGTAVADSLKESPYDRLPVSYKDKVRQPVWDLSKSSAGITVRFHSNSTSINLKWTVLNDFDKILKSGDQNIFYVKDNLLDDEGTVDGVHFTDLGFLRYADYLLKNFKEFMLIN
jgi:hypothetical protein